MKNTLIEVGTVAGLTVACMAAYLAAYFSTALGFSPVGAGMIFGALYLRGTQWVYAKINDEEDDEEEAEPTV